MAKKLIPTHKYKTTVLFYDDNLEYLSFLKSNLASEQYNFIFISNLDDFNAYLKSSEKIKAKLPELFTKLDNEISDNSKHDAFDFDISKINQFKEINDKSDEISTVFIDNNLKTSEYNGLCICGNIGESSFNKVLLTGECDLIDAINALNTKAIDLYIEKYDLRHKALENSNIIEKIMTELNKLTNAFFIANNTYVNELTSDNNFKQLFDEIIKNHNIVEYYLFDKETFLLINSTGEKLYLKCWHENKFAEYFELHADELNGNKEDELNDIRNRQLIPTDMGVKTTINFKTLYYCIY